MEIPAGQISFGFSCSATQRIVIRLPTEQIQSRRFTRKIPSDPLLSQRMAGIRGEIRPPGNQNAFRHGLAGIAQRRADGVLDHTEQSIREEILSGFLADKG